MRTAQPVGIAVALLLSLSPAWAAQVGDLTVPIREYDVPTPQSRPHDPAMASDGSLWYTGQMANRLGRLDPKTGEVRLKEVPTPNAVPYGIVVSSSGVPYFCEFGSNKLASVNPATMEITEYALPTGARPRRLAITTDDVIYYSDYGRGYLGRFDTKTGKQQEWASPGGPDSRPYGIAITPDGTVWYSESGVRPNTLVRFDPRSQAFAREAIPSGGGVVRNMVATPTGLLYLACSGVNKVAVVETR